LIAVGREKIGLLCYINYLSSVNFLNGAQHKWLVGLYNIFTIVLLLYIFLIIQSIISCLCARN